MRRSTPSFLHLLLALLLVCVQTLAGAHAIEHALGEAQGLPTHNCELCLGAHDLGTALPSVAAAPDLLNTSYTPFTPPATGRSVLPALTPRQQAPPAL